MPEPISAGAAILGSSIIGGLSSKSAADTQANAANRAADLQKQQYDQTRADQEPWRQAGVNALGKLSSGDVMGYMDPSYQFRLNEGLKAIRNRAGSQGQIFSGNTLKGLEGYGQSMASQEYNNAFNRLGTLAGFGTNANATNATAGQNYATGAGNMITGGAAAQAAGNIGVANAFGGGASQYLKYNQGNDLLAVLRGNSSPSNADLVKQYMS
jgi:hypothetical protein